MELSRILKSRGTLTATVKDTMKQLQSEINAFPLRGTKFLRRLQAEKRIDLSIDYGRSFSFVESKLVSLQKANPGSLIKLQTLSVKLDSQCEAEQRFYGLPTGYELQLDEDR